MSNLGLQERGVLLKSLLSWQKVNVRSVDSETDVSLENTLTKSKAVPATKYLPARVVRAL